MTPQAILEEGNDILGAVLVPAGFKAVSSSFGHGSGGDFGVSRWVRRDQFIEVHVRWALGMVLYGWGEDSFDHTTIAAALGAATSYPGFSHDPLDGFRHLVQDLTGPLAAILGPDSRQVRFVVRGWRKPPPRLP